nr:MAG TPA: Major capsid protein [Microviridae sp.]
MSDFSPLDRARINTHRSSFDLSSKKLFTAKVGEILPCYWQIAIPDTKYRISSDWFTRTVPVNTAAYTRIKEYYDFYAVPLRLLSRALPQAFTQMTEYVTSATSDSRNTDILKNVPYCNLSDISSYFDSIYDKDYFDDVSLPLAYGSAKILDLLGYGSFMSRTATSLGHVTASYFGLSIDSPTDNPLVYSVSQRVNILPILAYQKIYYDFFSHSQWEKHLAYAYNVDYWPDNTSIIPTKEMLKLRYANYPKDYFMGVLPNSQYGSVAVLPSSFTSAYTSNRIVSDNRTNTYLFQQQGSGAVSMTESVSANTPVTLNSDLSALSIRATEYLQRWKEVVQFSSKDYSDQMAAQFGIKAPEYMGNHAHYIGGWSSVININEVLNTNLNTQDSQASIAGKGVGSNQGYTLTYDCGAEHQIIMCVYHSVPLLDWELSGQNPQLTVSAVSDFPQPAFDQLGMQPVPVLNFHNNLSIQGSGNLGYNLRYWQWKSSVDTVHAGFRTQGGYSSWVAAVDGEEVLTPDALFSYQSFKVRPQQMNSIFLPQVSGSHSSVQYDQLLCNVNFQVYAVQNLDRNGLPY